MTAVSLDRINSLSGALAEEVSGTIECQAVVNDGEDHSMIILTGLKRIFQKQLPNMPADYIARLVYDKNHVGLALVKPDQTNKVMGGVSFRPFPSKKFAEIVFLAISGVEQVKGYGSRLMTHLKRHAYQTYGITSFLTYADNFAVGYFKKQGFTADISLPQSLWVGYIKDYEGGTLMQCTINPKVEYMNVKKTLALQKRAVLYKIYKAAENLKENPGLDYWKKHPNSQLNPAKIPGLIEAGWSPDMERIASLRHHQNKDPVHQMMESLIKDMQANSHAWPFMSPVTGVEGYYETIKEPMDLKTLSENFALGVYSTLEAFTNDVNRIFNNCRIFNEAGSRYVRMADSLEKFFLEKLHEKASDRAVKQAVTRGESQKINSLLYGELKQDAS